MSQDWAREGGFGGMRVAHVLVSLVHVRYMYVARGVHVYMARVYMADTYMADTYMTDTYMTRAHMSGVWLAYMWLAPRPSLPLAPPLLGGHHSTMT